ncbi:hypothetical protein KIL84_002875 [Mauremys mutica]|uniref:Uncharacterized protein n=1 Tax=Mauremys mutica TaxID=74926 RepID=A0A9D3WSQ4_9SAUR|nr:hypothetical protein KIL84_002875 [Mauremys mutica]
MTAKGKINSSSGKNCGRQQERGGKLNKTSSTVSLAQEKGLESCGIGRPHSVQTCRFVGVTRKGPPPCCMYKSTCSSLHGNMAPARVAWLLTGSPCSCSIAFAERDANLGQSLKSLLYRVHCSFKSQYPL